MRRRASGAVKRDIRSYIRRYTSPNEKSEYGYPLSSELMQFNLNFERSKSHKAAVHLTECDVINDVKLFPTVYISQDVLSQIFDVIQSDVVLQKQELE